MTPQLQKPLVRLLFLVAQGETRIRKLAEAFGYKPNSNGTINYRIDILKKSGYLERPEHNKTGMRLTPKALELLRQYAFVNGEEVWKVVRHVEENGEDNGRTQDEVQSHGPSRNNEVNEAGEIPLRE